MISFTLETGRAPGTRSCIGVERRNKEAVISDSIFTREIKVESFEEGQELRLRGSLSDTRLGEPLHRLEVEMVVSVWEGEIRRIDGSFPTLPMEECAEGLGSLDELVGAYVKPGFSDFVKSTVGSNRGCSHLAALIMNMGNVCVQGRGAYLRKHVPDNAARDRAMARQAKELGLLDSCVAWREDGPIVRRWRQEHPEDDPKY